MPPRKETSLERFSRYTAEQRSRLIDMYNAHIAVNNAVIKDPKAFAVEKKKASDAIVQYTLDSMDLECLEDERGDSEVELAKLRTEVETLRYQLSVYKDTYGDLSGLDKLDVDSPENPEPERWQSDQVYADGDSGGLFEEQSSSETEWEG